MPDLEKVIKGLECIISSGTAGMRDDCANCIYPGGGDCLAQALRDALTLLEPRVLTPEELYSQETVWFEEKPNHTMKQLTQDGIAALVFVGLLHNWNGYGTVWRCWTSRPSDAQKEKTPWTQSGGKVT